MIDTVMSFFLAPVGRFRLQISPCRDRTKGTPQRNA